MPSTFQITLSGQVQGVGFRPFIYKLAKNLGLKGWVYNGEAGVIIQIEATQQQAELFLKRIINEKPPVANILKSKLTKIALRTWSEFSILASPNAKNLDLPLTADFAICKSCQAEIEDLTNRRYGYAFTTCTQCGPRYAITTKFPFERQHTTLADFEMCPLCQREYEHPNDKRFHSQTNSCATCGIQMELWNSNNQIIDLPQDAILKQLSIYLEQGHILALKNTNGYLLCCDANNSTAIAELRARKKRPYKPFAVLYPTLEMIKSDFEVSEQEQASLSSPQAPIVILHKPQNPRLAQASIAPKLKAVGVFLPTSALLKLLLNEFKQPIVATSGNIHGSAIIAEASEAVKLLRGVADYFLHHNLKLQFPQDDSVIQFGKAGRLILRRARGFAPNYLKNQPKTKPILALGAHLKSTFTLKPNNHIYISPHFGNLDSHNILERYQQSLRQHLTLFNSLPEVILIDLHEQYQSSYLGHELAEQWGTKLLSVQHHKAHFTSVLAEHNLRDSKSKILGVIWDGTGLGTDGMVWGGEFFTYQDRKIERVAHFDYYDWLAQNKMAQEPRLPLFTLLHKYRLQLRSQFSLQEWNIYAQMLRRNLLKTSSVGRLFDAVAAALDLCDYNSFEGESAMILETCAAQSTGKNTCDFLDRVRYGNIPSHLLIQRVFEAKLEGRAKTDIAFSFIYTLAKSIIRIAQQESTKIITCSGGVFQNLTLQNILSDLCAKHGFELKNNLLLAPNDENISFGQLMYYLWFQSELSNTTDF